MYHLTYFSTASTHFSEEDLENLLKVSKSNNQRNGITGILLFIDGLFLQLLEGRKDNVLNIFKKIQEDERHYDVLKLFEGEKNATNFEKWSMGFRNFPLSEYKNKTGFEDLSNNDFITNVLKTNHPKIINTLNIFYSEGL